ncbi:MAG: high light inducible protein [Synechococcaceae cyanobacterium RL_1_2]|nr:high light inducible protein [Synechococcaceae cyanobacterium RL_1_2]
MQKGYSLTEGDRLNNFAVEPTVYVDAVETAGWTKYAELLNGRLAMIGFVALIGTELLTGSSLVEWFTSL